jgi:hypothetical protein
MEELRSIPSQLTAPYSPLAADQKSISPVALPLITYLIASPGTKKRLGGLPF